MKNNIKFKKASIAIVFIWIGFVCAISFMEAWLKFRAPNITTTLGLGIGQLVFSALNKVELFLMAVLLLLLFLRKKRNTNSNWYKAFSVVVAIVLLQTLWLLPTLDKRVDLILLGKEVAESKLHLLFVLLEICKVIGLFYCGIQLLIKKENS